MSHVRRLMVIMAAIAAFVAAAPVAVTAEEQIGDAQVRMLRLKGTPSGSAAVVRELSSGSADDRLKEVQDEGYTAYYLQDNIHTWLKGNTGAVYLAAPEDRPTAGWYLEWPKTGSVICMRPDDGPVAQVVEAVAFLIATSSTPVWTSNANQACDPPE